MWDNGARVREAKEEMLVQTFGQEILLQSLLIPILVYSNWHLAVIFFFFINVDMK